MMKQGIITEIGAKAIDKDEQLLIFFGDKATATLKEYSIIQEIKDAQDLQVNIGDTIYFGDQAYQVTFVGNIANETLQTIQHVTFVFSEVPSENQLSSAIYLTPQRLPKIEVGMKIVYQQEEK